MTLLLRLLDASDKSSVLSNVVERLRAGKTDGRIFSVNPSSFEQVPGSPYAYWVSDRVRRLFAELPAFEGYGWTVRVGLQTSDDFRFVRAWWNVGQEVGRRQRAKDGRMEQPSAVRRLPSPER